MLISVIRNASDNDKEFQIKGFAAFADKLIASRKYKCDCCGLKSERFMRLVSRNGIYSQLKPEQFLVCCPFCFCTLRLEQGKGKGNIAYMPELTQQQINMICHVIWFFSGVKVLSSTQFHYANGLYESLLTRVELVETVLGEKSSLPENFAFGLKAMPDDDYSKRAKAFGGLRFLPNKNGFFSEFEYWRSTVYPQMMGQGSENWSALGQAIKKVLPDVRY
jgi:intracellular multiplication protein IcmJ